MKFFFKELLLLLYLQTNLPSNWATSSGAKRMLKFCTAPGSTVPIVGSMVKGGSAGFAVRRDITLARALVGRASVDSAAALLHGREVTLSSGTCKTCSQSHKTNFNVWASPPDLKSSSSYMVK